MLVRALLIWVAICAAVLVLFALVDMFRGAARFLRRRRHRGT